MITTIEKIEKEIITLAEFSKDQQSFIRGIVKLSYNEGLQKGQTLPIDSVSNMLQWCYNYVNKQDDSDEKQRLIEELKKLGCL